MKKTTELFIIEAKEKFGDKYDYSKVQYTGCKDKVCIICHEKDEFGEEHGEFWQTPTNHISGRCGCPKCVNNVKMTTSQFIKKANLKHSNRYDYSKVNYINNHTNVIIVCKEHGEFLQLPTNHLKGLGCPVCGRALCDKNRIVPIQELLKRARLVHNDYYDYSLISLDKNVRSADKIPIICPKHGIFYLTINSHISGQGCIKCGRDRTTEAQKLTNEEFIERCKEIHPEYDYSITSYQNLNHNIKYICPIHGVIELNAKVHLFGKCGCPKCSKSHGEKEIILFLKTNNIEYQEQYEIPCSVNISGKAYVDFYIPSKNLMIEFNGKLHYIPMKYFGGELAFLKQLLRDQSVRDYCKSKSIDLLEISYKEQDKIQEILIKILNNDK